ncbi:MAG TPA: M28 family metallopeptidase [Candidatus Solibacter sp.]|nr:M28 family metallopeptidase [Candidatus Solibacter sp.]
MRLRLFWWVVLALALVVLACDRDNDAAVKQTAPSAAASTAEPAKPQLNFPADNGPPPAFDGDRAMQYVKEIVKFGPRPLGTANHKKVEEYLGGRLKGDQVEDDVFTADTPVGKFPVHNIIAKFPGTKDGIIIVASHYDTNYPLRDTSYVGANDGGSSSAVLLELANQLRGKPRDGYSVWLVWDDAEEAMKPDTEMPFMDDSLYGISHLAEKWQADGTLKKVKAFLLADMIGDADLEVERDSNSTVWLEGVVYEAATRLGYQSHFFTRNNQVSDDHLPFVKRGVPCADLIDFTYGYNNVFWHTPQDTVDKISPKSMQIVGSVILESVRMLDRMEPLPPK